MREADHPLAKRQRHSERGIALIMSVFMTVIATLIVAALAMSWQPDVDFVTKARKKEMAFQAADAGMRQAEAFLYSLFYARLGSPEDPQTIPPDPYFDLTWAPRALGDNTEDTNHKPVNGIDNVYNGVFSEMDNYFYGTAADRYISAASRSTGQNMNAVVWPSQGLPSNRRARYKVMISESATVTTNNTEDRAIDTYSRQVTIYSVGVITTKDAMIVPKLRPLTATRVDGNCNPLVLLKKRIIFQVRRRRGWAATFLDAKPAENPAFYPAPTPDPNERYLPLPNKTLRLTDASGFNERDVFIFSQRTGTALSNESHIVGSVKRPPTFPIHSLDIAGSPLDTGSINYQFDSVVASRPLVLSVSRASLPLLNARQFVTAVAFHLLGQVISSGNTNANFTNTALDTLVHPSNPETSFLTKQTGGVNDLTRWNTFIWYVSAGTSGAAPPAGMSTTDMETRGWLPPSGDASRTLYDAWRNLFIDNVSGNPTTNVQAGTFRDIPTTDLLIDTTRTDYSLQLTYRDSPLPSPPPAGLSIPYPITTYPLSFAPPTPAPGVTTPVNVHALTDSNQSPAGAPVRLINYAVVPNPDGDYTDWIVEEGP